VADNVLNQAWNEDGHFHAGMGNVF